MKANPMSLYEPEKSASRMRIEPARNYKDAIQTLGECEYASTHAEWRKESLRAADALSRYDRETLLKIITQAIDATKIEELGRVSQITKEASRGNYAYAATLEKERSALHQVGDMLLTLVATEGECAR